ncbi:MAG: hypothetical protein ACLFUR_00265 [Candidatus Hadarchaeia archaeon]
MIEPDDSEKKERRILLYFLGISISFILLVGGIIVFVLALLEIEFRWIGGILSAYLSFALTLDTTFLHRPLRKFGLRKFFLAGSLIFLLISIGMFSSQLL